MFGRVVTFKLGGEGKIPDPDLPPIDATPKAPSFGDEAQLTTGSYYYGRMCGACHGPLARSSGVLPDIRWSPFAADKDAWLDIVSEGALKESGMIGFGEYLTDDEVEAIRAYVLFEANPETP
jgi:mono/diheme cytochrome c family protein